MDEMLQPKDGGRKLAVDWQLFGSVLLLLCKFIYGTMVMLKTVFRIEF